MKIKMRYLVSILILTCIICGCSDYSENLGCGYTYVHEGGNDNYIFYEYPAKGGEIPSNIISFDYDKQFIIAKQKPNEYDCAYEKEYVYPLGRDTVYYWLIVKQQQKVFGPLDFVSFQKLKEQYSVSDKLILK
jgi:hypothetical protein